MFTIASIFLWKIFNLHLLISSCCLCHPVVMSLCQSCIVSITECWGTGIFTNLVNNLISCVLQLSTINLLLHYLNSLLGNFILMILSLHRMIAMMSPEDSWVAKWQRIGNIYITMKNDQLLTPFVCIIFSTQSCLTSCENTLSCLTRLKMRFIPHTLFRKS